jgi:lysophospholipase L1-like esterase
VIGKNESAYARAQCKERSEKKHAANFAATTCQLLRDVAGTRPLADEDQPRLHSVVILAGANDLAGYSGPATEGTISENFMSMTELAKANGIRVVLSSVTPVCDCFRTLTDRRPPGKILGMNRWLKGYAEQSGSVYLDYYSALADGRTMKKELTADGLVPNNAGYAVMAPLAEKAIVRALAMK